MAFAIYYFKDKTVEVGKISWMRTEDQRPKLITQCPNLEDEDGWMEVKWDIKGRKKTDGPAFFAAKVLMFGDNYSDLCKKRQEFINGEDIWQEALKRKSKPNTKWKDVEKEDHEVPPKKIQDGHVEMITDEDINSRVVEIRGVNVFTTYISTPAEPRETLGLTHPLLVFLIKNQRQQFTFEVEVKDDKNMRRRFRVSTYNRTKRVSPLNCALPLELDEDWNQIIFDIADVTRRLYGSNHKETLRVNIHANCRLRRVYFSDRRYTDEELPADFKLPIPKPKAKK